MRRPKRCLSVVQSISKISEVKYLGFRKDQSQSSSGDGEGKNEKSR